MEPTVPRRKKNTKAIAWPLAAMVTAGRMGKMASGDRPWRNPVEKVASENLDRIFPFYLPSSLILSKSKFLASLYPK